MSLYYYTTTETMSFILKKGDIFATNISYLNDSEEYINGLKELRELLCGDKADRYVQSAQNHLAEADAYREALKKAHDIYSISFSQEKDLLSQWYMYAKESGVPVILVGHINKDGAIAGPKVLEHIVDTVLQFEGDRQYLYRILRSIKNRFGSTNEIGIYEMAQKGLKEVKNPSEMLLSENRDEEMSGIAIGVTMEGIRPFMVEVQALVSSAAYGTPQRSVTGFDQRRLNMLLAVLEKRAKFKLSQKDVFLNIAGGLKVADPALDMAVVAAIMSSNFDISIERKWAFAGEVGLSGEIRTVTRIEQRVSEAQKLGFESILIPKGNLKGIKDTFNINIVEVGKVEEVFKNIFG